MLSKAAQEKVLKALNLSADVITDLMKDGEFDVDIPKVHIFDDAGLAELKDNVRKTNTAAEWEIWGKKMNADHKLGLSAADAKDQAKVIAALNAKAVKDAGVVPDDAAIKAKDDKIQALQATIDTKDSELATWQSRLKEREINDEYRSYLHPDRNPALDDTEWIERIKRNYEIVEEGGIKALKDKATGKVFNDTKENPLPAKDVLTKVFTEKDGWLKPQPAEPVTPTGPKPTHNPARPTGNNKYKTAADVMKEVEKKLPNGTAKEKKDLFKTLSAEIAA